jgi:hypothetical protein
MKLREYMLREAMRARDIDGAIRILLEEYGLSSRAGELESVNRKAGLNFSADSGLVIYFVGPSIISWADPGGFYSQLGNYEMPLSAARIRSVAYKFPASK